MGIALLKNHNVEVPNPVRTLNPPSKSFCIELSPEIDGVMGI